MNPLGGRSWGRGWIRTKGNNGQHRGALSPARRSALLWRPLPRSAAPQVGLVLTLRVAAAVARKKRAEPGTGRPCSLAWSALGAHSRPSPARQPRTLIRVPVMAPTLWGPSSRLRQSGAWIPPTPSVRGRLDAAGTAIAKAILVPMRGASVLRPVCGGRLPCPSQAPTTPGAAWPGLAKSPASRLPRPPLLPAESLPRVLPRPPVRAPTP